MRWDSGEGRSSGLEQAEVPRKQTQGTLGREGRNRVPQGAGRQGWGSQDFHLLHSIISTTDSDRLGVGGEVDGHSGLWEAAAPYPDIGQGQDSWHHSSFLAESVKWAHKSP